MLDTNIVSELVRNPGGRVTLRIRVHGSADLCVSIIAVAEIRYGCARRNSPRLLRNVEIVLSALDVIAFERPADDAYGAIRAELESAGTPIGPTDLFIAAHARALNATLVTANVAEFSRVRGLKIENWLA
jgi:tRNA(fMet)-specific endonuclease VapC